MKKLLFTFIISFISVGIVSADNANYSKVYCGDIPVPTSVISIVSTVIAVIQIAVPLLIIIFGSIDLLKAVIAQKDEEIKKGFATFIKRLIAGALVFFVIVIVKLVIGVVAPSSDPEYTSMWKCADYFINGM